MAQGTVASRADLPTPARLKSHWGYLWARHHTNQTLVGRTGTLETALAQKKGNVQYGALPYAVGSDGELRILLVTSRGTRRWIIPKGWPMAGKKPHEVAAIEAFEEAGVRGKAKKKPLGYFTYLKTLDNGQRAPCCVQVHLLNVKESCDVFREKGQRQTEWVSCVEAARRVREPELKGLFLSMQQVVFS